VAEIIIFLLVFGGIIALALLIQGVITMLATWLIIGGRPALGQVIKANVLSWLTYLVIVLTLLFKWQVLVGLGVPLWLLLPLAGLLLLILPCWIFADCLGINLLQAMAISLLVMAINTAISIAIDAYLPAVPALSTPKLMTTTPAASTLSPSA
jgi:hypothetical protein